MGFQPLLRVSQCLPAASLGPALTVSGATAVTEINSDVEAFVDSSTLNAASGGVFVDADANLTATGNARGFSVDRLTG